MNTRRKFLSQATLATTALMAINPFKSLADTLVPVTGVSSVDNKLVLLHTGNEYQHPAVTSARLSKLKRETGNLLLLHAGQLKNAPDPQLNYDISMPANEEGLRFNDSYRIIYKGNIKIGIIHVTPGEANIFNRTNDLAIRLKEEKKCTVVVCLSQLGYSNKNATDDLKLAAASTHLDIILSGHPSNTCKKPFIARNSLKQEVVINSYAGNNIDFGSIELGFDENNNKRSITINKMRKHPAGTC